MYRCERTDTSISQPRYTYWERHPGHAVSTVAEGLGATQAKKLPKTLGERRREGGLLTPPTLGRVGLLTPPTLGRVGPMAHL